MKVVKSAAALFLLIFILLPSFVTAQGNKCVEYHTCITKNYEETSKKSFNVCKKGGCAAWRCVKDGVFYFGYGCAFDAMMGYSVCRKYGETIPDCGPDPTCAVKGIDETPPSNLASYNCEPNDGMTPTAGTRYPYSGIYETTKMDAFKLFVTMMIGWIFMYGW